MSIEADYARLRGLVEAITMSAGAAGSYHRADAADTAIALTICAAQAAVVLDVEKDEFLRILGDMHDTMTRAKRGEPKTNTKGGQA